MHRCHTQNVCMRVKDSNEEDFVHVTHQDLCQDAVIIRFHGNNGLVSLNLTKSISRCHCLTWK